MLLHYFALTYFIKLSYLSEETEGEPGSLGLRQREQYCFCKGKCKRRHGVDGKLAQICSNLITILLGGGHDTPPTRLFLAFLAFFVPEDLPVAPLHTHTHFPRLGVALGCQGKRDPGLSELRPC